MEIRNQIISDHWGLILGVIWFHDEVCYRVYFHQNRETVIWPVYGHYEDYEFRKLDLNDD